MYRTKDDLLDRLLKTGEESSEANPDSGAIISSVRAKPQVVSALNAVMELVPTDVNEELEEYFQFALMGVSQGFVERNLSPFLKEHLEIIPPLLDDIRSVYEQLQIMSPHIDREEFRFRAFDYGIHKAYYLDWRLYMSKEMY